MEKQQIAFIGEQLIWGTLGNLAISMAFATAILAFLCYVFSIKNSFKGIIDWKWMGRISFFLHALSVFAIVGIIFYILVNHRFEYHYVFQHSSKSLPSKYVFAAFWEGQEGSTLLWAFWLEIIAVILMFTSKQWEGRVMSIFALVLAFLMSMILGIVIDLPFLDEYKLGSNPFTLTRVHFAGAPFTQMPDYLKSLDGSGLAPSLQNYWMTIHPPTLFLGFALTIVPYLYAVAGLWSGKLNEWSKPALPWVFTGVAILGGGILMGGAWAYESLNFGGFWIWDAVENSSLVAWLTLVAAGHLMMVPHNKGINLKAAIVMAPVSFILVLYSTFLTKSGVLGDASVHSFTDLGMTDLLLVYLFFFLALPPALAMRKISSRINYFAILLGVIALGIFANIILYLAFFSAFFFMLFPAFVNAKNQEYFPTTKKDDHIYSREFWLFVAALILAASSIHITFLTSIPVFNKIFKSKFAPFDIADYNGFQAVFAILILSLMAYVQHLRYKQDKPGEFWKRMIRSVIVALVLIIAGLIAFEEFRNGLYIMVVFASLMGILGNIDYIIQYLKRKWKFAGPAIAHIGFGVVILGAVISAGHKKIISENKNGINLEMLNAEFKNKENIMLHQHDTVQMGPYYLSFVNDTIIGYKAYYTIDYLKKQKDGSLKKIFTLTPHLIMDDKKGNSVEPATKHYLHKDVFTHVTYVDLDKLKRKSNPQLALMQEQKEVQHFTLEKGDTIFGTSYYVIFEGFEALSNIDHVEETQPLSVTLRGSFVIKNFKGEQDTIRPIYEVRDNMLMTRKDVSEKFGIELEVEKILDDKQIEVAMREVQDPRANNFIIMQAIIFPGINILWCGCFLMVFGTFFAVIKRITQRKNG